MLIASKKLRLKFLKRALLAAVSVFSSSLVDYLSVSPAVAQTENALVSQALNDSRISDLLLQQADALLQKNPRDLRAYETRVAVFLQRGWLDRAIEDLRSLCSINPEDTRLLEMKATAEAIKGDFNSGIADITKAISLNPHAARYYCCRATILLQANRLTEASADSEKALNLDSRLAPAYENLAEIQYRMKNFHITIEYCNSTIARAPSFADAYYYRSLAYEKMHNQLQAALDKAKAKELGFSEPTIFKNKYI